ncbi:copper homeostasis protein CutC [Rapidithrix thailandica]|uniref:PF03932 family protein CutC n=1 Tax=Rapidithrix thailandica TaxID=413964 RepID=A0AAW9S806_9BACT
MSTKQFVLEVCADSVESTIKAQEGGADRVELCDNLYEGGTTPSIGLIELTRSKIDIDLHVLVRPRGGDFCYSDIEVEVMKRDIERLHELNVQGIVVGALDAEGQVDIERMQTIMEVAGPLSVTFHRAFDMAADPIKALDDLLSLGVDRLLTSGQAKSAFEGRELIKQLQERAGENLLVMAGGGVNASNVEELHDYTGVKEFHMSGAKVLDSRMKYRNRHVFMGKKIAIPEEVVQTIRTGKGPNGVPPLRLPEFELSLVDTGKVSAVKNKILLMK